MSRKDHRTRNDQYTRKARSHGYRARSVYKLEELAQRFGLLGRGLRVLDLGAAPGSWTQFAAEKVGSAGTVVAVDIKEMDSITGHPNVTTITSDLFAPETAASLMELGPFDVVLSDAAPNTTGNRTVDTSRSCELVERVLELSRKLLKPGGSLAAKLFQGGDEQRLVTAARDAFLTARLAKPRASRDESMEVFLVATGRLATDDSE